jgi:hypothetical protein
LLDFEEFIDVGGGDVLADASLKRELELAGTSSGRL